MAEYRQLHTRTWDDTWFSDLTPEFKLLFIYLFGNEKASIIGLYELPLKTISFETGLNRDTVKKGLDVFSKADKVSYDEKTSVIWVKNMHKYQASSSVKLKARIASDIRNVPECKLKNDAVAWLQLNTVLIPYPYGIDTLSIPYPPQQSDTETETETETDTLNAKEKNCEPPIEPIIEAANKTMDAILEIEKRAKGKKYTQLPEIYIPYAREFSCSTGLEPSKKDMAEWISTIDDWIRAGYQPEDISRAVREIMADGRMAITRPASITWKLKDIFVKRRYEQPAPPVTPPPSGEKYVLPPRRVI